MPRAPSRTDALRAAYLLGQERMQRRIVAELLRRARLAREVIGDGAWNIEPGLPGALERAADTIATWPLDIDPPQGVA
jgi:hypothetical protein